MTFPMPSNSLCARLWVGTISMLMLSQWLHAIPIRVLAWDNEIAARKLAIADAKGAVPIEAMHPSKRTQPYQVTVGEKPITIQALDKTDKNGKPAASEVIIPEGTKEPLLLLLPDVKSATGLRLLVLEDDASHFPWGGIRFINACGKPLVFAYENKVLTLPASWTPVVVNPGGHNRNMETRIFSSDLPKHPIYSSVWEQNQNVRTLIIIVPGEDPRLGPVAMKMIAENRRVKEMEAAASHSRTGQGR